MVLSVLITVACLFSQCEHKEPLTDDVLADDKGRQFIGSASCQGCHKDIYDEHLRTAHFLTSQPGSEEFIKGHFENGKNTYAFNKSVVVAMEQRADGFYQVEYLRGEEKKAKKMDIVVGSGTMGQSSLYWQDHYLFQLPITYFTAADQWSNSPGFPDRVVFNRVITSRCLECHSTYVKTIPGEEKKPEQFDKNKIIYGVDCEKCHGPAAEHVKFQSANPQDTVARHIINPAIFTRKQKLDLCAMCHGGRLEKTQPSFTYTAGKPLEDFFKIDTSMPDPDNIDVHGNQYGLMRASKCFKGSEVMTCNSCHNVHENEKGKTALFSQRCMSCHTESHVKFCPVQKKMGNKINENCVDCHMPLKPSRAIAVFLPGAQRPLAANIRSHYIAVYEEESKKIAEMMRGLRGRE